MQVGHWGDTYSTRCLLVYPHVLRGQGGGTANASSLKERMLIASPMSLVLACQWAELRHVTFKLDASCYGR